MKCDPDVGACTGLKQLECRIQLFQGLELSTLTAAPDGSVTVAQASMLKTLATELHQATTPFALDAAGPFAAAGVSSGPNRLTQGAFGTKKYFATGAASIYSGTNETYRNLIARHL